MREEYILGTSRVCTWLRCYSWWHECCNKMKPRSILWAIVSNSTSWIFQSIQVTLLVNMCHYTFCCKHTVVPTVASGKSVKLRSPFICCSVVESLFCECELLRLSTAGFSKFHNCESCIQWHQPFHNVAWIHLEWILKHHWFIASRAMGTQIFQKSGSHLKILGTSRMIWSKFSYWQSKNMLQYKMLLPSQSCTWYLCIPALESARVCACACACTQPHYQNLAVRHCACQYVSTVRSF
jgi:hypothetical protein